MAQATQIGLCSDNLVTILHPSSTLEGTTTTATATATAPTLVAGPTAFTGTTRVSIPNPAIRAYITGVATIPSGSGLTLTVGGGPTWTSRTPNVSFATTVVGPAIFLTVGGTSSGPNVSGTFYVYQ